MWEPGCGWGGGGVRGVVNTEAAKGLLYWQ